MVANPELFANEMHVPFVNEMFVLGRDDDEFEVNKIPGHQLAQSSRRMIVSIIGVLMSTIGHTYLHVVWSFYVCNRSCYATGRMLWIPNSRPIWYNTRHSIAWPVRSMIML